ncbi:MAG: hypothetical protein ACSLFL_11455 [Alphaproteobacteria bacterium]
MSGVLRHWRAGVRLLGGALIVLGAVALLSDLHITGGGLAYRPVAVGEYWHKWDPPSLNLLQAIVERYLLPQLWSHVLLPLLLAPAWIVTTLKGAVLMGISFIRKST